jgi:hypothetical protein
MDLCDWIKINVSYNKIIKQCTVTDQSHLYHYTAIRLINTGKDNIDDSQNTYCESRIRRPVPVHVVSVLWARKNSLQNPSLN